VALGPGSRIGPYEIVSPLGAGGMGEVYRARDAKLNRDVALKVLPDAFALDPDRLARFRREAQVLASLNHPHIGAIYGFEDSGSTHALVLELVEGPTLSDRIEQGPIPLEEALPIATQIADALEAAHAQGVIHRDLKPANIKLTPSGKVKVLDFGLAKMLETDRVSPSLSMSPTIGVQATYAGVILGTASYMSPEQARGKALDQRTDIWSFGCVLFEMLSGRKTFDAGDTVSDAVAAILTRDPDWSALPDGLPSGVRTVLRRCLQKDPERRLHHIADARLELEEPASAPVEVPADAPPRSLPLWLRALPWAIAALALAAAAWTLWRPAGRAVEQHAVARLELNLPPGLELFTASTRSVVVSPDGRRIAFVGTRGGARQVYVRPLDQYDASSIRGSENATSCMFSPDGRSIAVVTAAGVLKAISLTDGLSTTVTEDVNFLYGVTWTPDDRFVFVRAGALWQVARGGGTAAPLTMLGGARKDTLHVWPTALPGGKAILFGAMSADQWRVDALTLATGERRTVVERASLPLYAASGHLVFLRDDRMVVAPFDASRLQLTGPATQLLESLPATTTLGGAIVDLSLTGTAVYSPTSAVNRLVWVSRQGNTQPVDDVLRNYANPRIAPDGNRVVVQADGLWIQDLARATFTRLASRDVVTNGFPIWTPDGRQIIYRTATGLQVQDADGSGRSRLIAGSSEFDYPGAVTPDGETLVFLRSTQETSFDVYALLLKDPGKVRTIVKTPAYEGGARLSPDGRWLTYVSNESGQNEIYLRPYDGPERRWQISSQGGTQPLWNPNGREVFYRNGDRMMAVDVTTSPDVKLSPPHLLFEGRYAFGSGITIANYDVTRDGQRFIMVKDEAGAARLNVVLNWFDDLARVAPAPAR
jgi:serine/threonine-protein kinase